MHEMSVAVEVCRLAEERLSPAELPQLVTVGLDVGDDSGLEPDNLLFCLEALLAAPPFYKARPEMTRCAGDVLRVTYLELDDDRQDN
ncbi:MAG TPA: hydrogenase/urease maturation nickel metallochaperone HypA [Gemmatimonadales bacterium]|nr:hydrogenase/urease maturation nickel metallochaperone HypA [Gemmatimonadales bacterium]